MRFCQDDMRLMVILPEWGSVEIFGQGLLIKLCSVSCNGSFNSLCAGEGSGDSVILGV